MDRTIKKTVVDLKDQGIDIIITESGFKLDYNEEEIEINQFDSYMSFSKFFDFTSKKRMLLRSSFISIISIVEYFYANILQFLLFNDSKNFVKAESKINLKELEECEDIQDIKNKIIEENIEKITRTNVLEWIETLKEKKIKTELDKGTKNKIYEAFLRRNLFVHNGGVVNSTYLLKADKRIHSFVKGDIIELDMEYIFDVIETMKKIWISIAIDVWYKVKKKDSERESQLTEITYSLLSNKDFQCAKTICEKCLENNIQDDEKKLILGINRWIAMKSLDLDWEKEEETIKAKSFEAYMDMFKIAKHALLNENKETYELFKKMLANDEISYFILCSYPLFKWFRQTEQFQQLLKEDEDFKKFYADIFKNKEKDNIQVDEVYRMLLKSYNS